MLELVPATAGCPGCSQLDDITVITLRHTGDDHQARNVVQALALEWPSSPGTLTGNGPWLAWRSPQETLALGLTHAALQDLLERLAPGRCDTALAIDLSEALVVFELRGPQLDAWLAHLVDASAIPRAAGSVWRCRLADVPVLLLRLDSERVWLVAERPIAPYLSNWLSYSHQGAFGAGG